MEELSNKEEIHTQLVYYVSTCMCLLWGYSICRVGTMYQSSVQCNRNMDFLSQVRVKHFPLSFSYNIPFAEYECPEYFACQTERTAMTL